VGVENAREGKTAAGAEARALETGVPDCSEGSEPPKFNQGRLRQGQSKRNTVQGIDKVPACNRARKESSLRATT